MNSRADKMILGILYGHNIPLDESVSIWTDHESDKSCETCDGKGHNKDEDWYDIRDYAPEYRHDDPTPDQLQQGFKTIKNPEHAPYGASTCFHCYGSGSVKGSTSSINMSNMNADSVFKSLGIHSGDSGGYSYGRWEPHELPDINRRIIRTLNQPKRRKGLTRDSVDTGGPGTGQARFIDTGIDDDYITNRVKQIGNIVQTAMKYGGGVNWG